jgi:ubiquinone/menaquinone biosynthesis C-methylase UbiE
MRHAADLAAYYAARVAEYERVYAKPERQRDLRQLRQRIPHSFAGLSVLEVACGTGYWTQHIAPVARRILATDLSPEVLAVAHARVAVHAHVQLRVADAMSLPEDIGQYEAAFAAFWWSHIPREELSRFLESLHARLVPGAKVVMLDNLFVAGSSTPITPEDARGNTYQLRQLENGSTYEVLKNFPSEQQIRADLSTAANVCYQALEYYWLVEYQRAA